MKRAQLTKLALWMKKNGMTQLDLAAVIRRNKTRACRIANGLMPNKDEMPLIVAWTNEEVRFGDFYEVGRDSGVHEASPVSDEQGLTK